MNAQRATSENERLAAWVLCLELNGWVTMTADEQKLYAIGSEDDDMFWVAVDIVTERDLANR